MSYSKYLSTPQRERLLQWVEDRNETFTIKDLETELEVHYLTAYHWVRALEGEGHITVVGTEGRTNIYAQETLGAEAVMNPEVMLARALKVKDSNKKELAIAEWAVLRLSTAQVAAMAHAFVYLFVRSYYYEAPDHQHLRGTASTLEVRRRVEEILAQAESDLAIVRQLLALRAPWVEGPAFALRFGTAPVGFNLEDALQTAQIFQKKVLGHEESQ